ncbi:BRCA1 C Terminus (BRCT) protein [Ruminiclostridium sufflavum DSM 19573]|uniref:BRCA1 C Terminus (BRCT) protein n=1 Tax=Ruminiclostridium sufflavum DSM 19573 TaxID=1121337 RepID=A0A318XZS9_9FIRM|nr:BRCT domain-containing protein [Ruminiclostridium sufflavum]PYG88510.1 BRCA1 C Terminus (BRCT) protein [Ruminiclostridium sufflavum DSM 19573]
MTIANYEEMEYARYTFKSELDKAINVLEGIITGIAIDEKVNLYEIVELSNWCDQYKEMIYRKPFDEIIPLIQTSIEDNILTESEIQDILWACDNFKGTSKYYNIITADIQQLHGIMHGILADNEITTDEIEGLRDWSFENHHLKGLYPYDELFSIISSVLSDGIIDEKEKEILKVFFSDFIDFNNSVNIDADEIIKLKETIKIEGLCSVDPDIYFKNNLFCFTGISSRFKRADIQNIVESLEGKFKDSVIKDTKYLVIGNNGNPCWAFSCYGRKVEQAMDLRKKGKSILIIHENDFWHAVENDKL